MPTLIGTDVVTSLSRQIVMPVIVDQIYGSNALFYRLNAANKKMYEGGMHVEVPFMYAEFTNGGEYQGYDLLDVSPNDTIKNGGWDLKQYYVPVTIDGRTLARCNTSMAVANVVTTLWEQARIQMADNLGTDLYSDGSNTKKIVGLKGAVDDTTVLASYAGLARSTNSWMNSTLDTTTTTLTLTALRNLVSNVTKGGHAPTILVARKEQYNRFWALNVANQRFPVGETGSDTQLASAGFSNLLFDGIPFVVDDKVFDGPSASNSAILALNEEFMQLAIFGSTDFEMQDFARPVNQDAMVGFLKWWGELMLLAPQTCGKMTAVAA